MQIVRNIYGSEKKLGHWSQSKYVNLDAWMALPLNTWTLSVRFNDTEIKKVLQYDRERQRNDEKIIVGTLRCDSNSNIINPINLKDAVESGIVTELDIEVYGNQDYLFESSALQLMKNFPFKHLRISALMYPSSFYSSHAEDVIRLINRYKGTLTCVSIYLEKVDMTSFRKIYKEVEDWTINTPTAEYTSLTASDINGQRCKSLPEYNEMQDRLNYLIKLKRASECFKEATDEQKKSKICANVIKNDPKFNKYFSKYDPSKIKKVIGNDNMYEILLGYYTDNSTILDYIPNLSDEQRKKHLNFDEKKLIVELNDRMGVITRIDNDLGNNNSTTNQQDEEMNDVDLTTSGTTVDCCLCLIM